MRFEESNHIAWSTRKIYTRTVIDRRVRYSITIPRGVFGVSRYVASDVRGGMRAIQVTKFWTKEKQFPRCRKISLGISEPLLHLTCFGMDEIWLGDVSGM